MVDNLAEKVDECPLNRGRCILLAYNWDRENCPLYGVAGCPLFRGCLSIEVNGRAILTFRIVRHIVGVRYSRVSVKWGSTAKTAYYKIGRNNVCENIIMGVDGKYVNRVLMGNAKTVHGTLA